MKKIALLSLGAAAVLVSCGPKEFTFTGNVADEAANGKMAYLMENGNQTAIDSAVVENGTVTFTRPADASKIYSVNLRVDRMRYAATFIGEAGAITSDMKEGKITGTPLNEKLSAFNQEMEELATKSNTKYENLFKDLNEKKIDKDKFTEEVGKIREEYFTSNNNILNKYFNENTQNPVGIMALSQMAENLSLAELDSLIAIAGPAAAEFGPIKTTREFMVKLDETSVGKMFKDFSAKTLDGKDAKLSDYVGKGQYTLVDFWASWCGPCMGEVPYLKDIYKEYGKKGLTVVGVAVWDQLENTKKAVEKEGLSWNILFEETKVATDTYGIRGIPQIILFGPDGKIVARDLRGDAMKAKIKEVMSK